MKLRRVILKSLVPLGDVALVTAQFLPAAVPVRRSVSGGRGRHAACARSVVIEDRVDEAVHHVPRALRAATGPPDPHLYDIVIAQGEVFDTERGHGSGQASRRLEFWPRVDAERRAGCQRMRIVSFGGVHRELRRWAVWDRGVVGDVEQTLTG